MVLIEPVTGVTIEKYHSELSAKEWINPSLKPLVSDSNVTNSKLLDISNLKCDKEQIYWKYEISSNT